MALPGFDPSATKAFDDEMRLTFAETRILDLKRQLCTEYERATKAEKRADEAEKANDTTDLDAMRALCQQLQQANEEKQAALEVRDKALKDAELAELESARLREALRKSQSTGEKLTKDLHEARNLRPGLDQTVVNQLLSTITARDTKIEQLVDKHDKLQSEHFAVMQRQSNKSNEESHSYQVKNEHQAIEMRDLGTKLAAAETSRDWFRQEHTKLLARDTQAAVNRLQATNVSAENSKLKADIKDLNNKIRSLKWDIGFYITDLDLAAADMRVFTCRHRKFSDIPDAAHSTREKNAWVVACEFFNEYQYDNEFLAEYNQARSFTLKHHRAHEAVNQGRADWSSNLKAELERIDISRGVNITYR